MVWNWQKSDWPTFQWNVARISPFEQQFLVATGVSIGTVAHLGDHQRDQLLVEIMSREALTTSAIEGELLNRNSVQSSIQRQLGLATDGKRAKPAEKGIAEIMVDIYRSYDQPLSNSVLCGWHRMLTAGRKDLSDIGRYRTAKEPMQIVSGPINRPTIHFEAPPSSRIASEMTHFIAWFNQTAPHGPKPLPTLTRAGISHLYFESIHPFEDGNGRIGRAIAQKALIQGFGQPIIIALAPTMLAHQKMYYEALRNANRNNHITDWLVWFAKTVLESQRQTMRYIDFIIAKTKFLDRLRGQLNERQEKAILRMLKQGPDGFKGGLSAGNYSTITGASPATTTRDLSDLTDKNALIRTGEHRYARYRLSLATPEHIP